MRAILTAIAALSILGCEVQLPEGQIRCATEGPACPDGWFCDETDFCRPPGFVAPADGGVDGPVDLGMDGLVDGSEGDGPDGDAGPACDRGGVQNLALEFASSEDDAISDIVTLDDGYLVVGSTRGTNLRVGCTDVPGEDRQNDVLVVRLDRDGRPRWIQRFGSAGGSESASAAIRRREGGFFIAGQFAGAFTLTSVDGAPIELTGNSGVDGFVMALNDNGGVLWARALTSMENVSPTQLASLDVFDEHVCLVGGTGASVSIARQTQPPFLVDATSSTVSGFTLCMRGDTGEPVWGQTEGFDGVNLVNVGIGSRRNQIWLAGSTGRGGSASLLFQSFQCTGSPLSCMQQRDHWPMPMPFTQRGLQIIPREEEVLVLGAIQGPFEADGQRFDLPERSSSLIVASLDPRAVTAPSINWLVELGAPPAGNAQVEARRMILHEGVLHIAGSYHGRYVLAPGVELPSNEREQGDRSLNVAFHASLDAGDGTWLSAHAFDVVSTASAVSPGLGSETVVIGGAAEDSVAGLMHEGGSDGFLLAIPASRN